MHPQLAMRRLAPLLDVLCDGALYDIKIVDGKIHAHCKGYNFDFVIDPKWIMQNIALLDQVIEILQHKREPKVLSHMCRIVGYYSVMDNWNISKLQEQKDRRKGNYGVPDVFTSEDTTRAKEARAS